jgi:hypothetical protein
VPWAHQCYNFGMDPHRPDTLRTCYVPGCPHPREYPPAGAPILCHAHGQEFAAFQPEALSQGVDVEGYSYAAREPWLRALAYDDWRMHVFMQEKEQQVPTQLEP